MWSSSALQQGIIHQIVAKYNDSSLETFPFLFSDHHAAQALLFAYLSLAYPNQAENYAEKSVEALESFMEVNGQLEQSEVALAGGYLGAAWLLQHLANIEIISRENVTELIHLETIIEHSLTQNLQHKNYDTLYGLVSKGIYYLERLPDDPQAIHQLEKIINYLDHIAIKKSGTVCWQDHFTQDAENQDKVRYNLGLAHGITGVISFLGKMCQHKIALEISKPLLEQSVQWLLQQEADQAPGAFPHMVIEQAHPHKHSRLAWCYGDLCIAVALMHAAKGLANQDWQQKALQIALDTTLRQSTEDAVIATNHQTHMMECGICHGTIGLAHIYRRFYQATQNSAFQIAANHWLTMTLHYPSTDSQQVCYKRMRGSINDPQKIEWSEDYGFLEGYGGIALVLLGFVDEQTDTCWDRLLLLDIV